MINIFVMVILFIGLPYSIFFSVGYVKRVLTPQVYEQAFDKSTYSSLERYGYLIFCALSFLIVLLLPSGFFRCVMPAAGLGISNALSPLNRNRRFQAFFAYFSAIFLSFYYFSGLNL